MMDNNVSLEPDHADEAFGHLLLMESLGTTQPDFSIGLLAQLANAATKGQVVDERQLNFMLAVGRVLKLSFDLGQVVWNIGSQRPACRSKIRPT